MAMVIAKFPKVPDVVVVVAKYGKEMEIIWGIFSNEYIFNVDLP